MVTSSEDVHSSFVGTPLAAIPLCTSINKHQVRFNIGVWWQKLEKIIFRCQNIIFNMSRTLNSKKIEEILGQQRYQEYFKFYESNSKLILLANILTYILVLISCICLFAAVVFLLNDLSYKDCIEVSLYFSILFQFWKNCVQFFLFMFN